MMVSKAARGWIVSLCDVVSCTNTLAGLAQQLTCVEKMPNP